ncbi:hypothetical protein [Galactobacter sp.]|uniref:hypothetical protein n=1 Tax=Galactobacter sp. TaxID=2676125 RepID=UPI0025C62A31|nr:hypothetical protein [Galactobacter sp.]
MLTYAEPSDLPEGLQTVNGVDALLGAASLIVDMLVRGAVYDTDDDGRPTDTHLVQVFRDATVMQVVWADETGGGASGAAPSQLGSLKFDATTDADGESVPPGVAPDAYRLLRVEGLIHSRVRVP